MATADTASVTPPRAPLWSFRNERFGGVVWGVVGLSLFRSMPVTLTAGGQSGVAGTGRAAELAV